MPWTSEQILALAPDASSAKSGKELSSPRKWVSMGQDGECAWGLCQGSGKAPYQTRIDLSGPAFKCSCPSRKFPCKHSLGLFLILAQQPDVFKEKKRPVWVEEWLSSRKDRAEKKAEKKEVETERESDPVVQAKRAAEQTKRALAREDKVSAGLEELERFARDIIRQGLVAVQNKPFSFWEGMAARLVDAQALGLARLVREMGGTASTGEGWQQTLLDQLSRLHVIMEGYKRLNTLPTQTQADLRQLIGFSVSQEDVQAQPGVRDEWTVAGQRVTEEDRLRVQRTWLWGKKAGRGTLILQFAHASQPLDVSLVPGTVLDAEVAYFPSAYPLRAILKTRHGKPTQVSGLHGYESIAMAVSAYSDGFKSFPWIEQFPMTLNAVTPVHVSGSWSVIDAAGHTLPISIKRGEGWRLMALSGGQVLSLFGEWNGSQLLPMATWVDGRYVQI